MTGAPPALLAAGLVAGVAALPLRAGAGCGDGAVAAWAPLTDPVNVDFGEGADSAIAFVAPEPAPELDNTPVIGAALLGLVATPSARARCLGDPFDRGERTGEGKSRDVVR